jgi:hypothetical protein
VGQYLVRSRLMQERIVNELSQTIPKPHKGLVQILGQFWVCRANSNLEHIVDGVILET